MVQSKLNLKRRVLSVGKQRNAFKSRLLLKTSFALVDFGVDSVSFLALRYVIHETDPCDVIQ